MSSLVQIYNNTISNSTAAGLSLALRNASIFNNTISNNAIGVVLDGGDATCQLSHNHIQDNDIGVQVMTARYTIQQNNFIHNRRQAAIQKSVRLIEIPLLPFYRQKWDNNYWDDWKTPLPRPISGLGIITFRYIVPNAYVDIPIAFFLFVEVDRYPAQKPFDIPGVS
jgi:parallel beta-helix repeat protein